MSGKRSGRYGGPEGQITVKKAKQIIIIIKKKCYRLEIKTTLKKLKIFLKRTQNKKKKHQRKRK